MSATSILSKKLEQSRIPLEEKELILENGLRYRILELENKLRKIETVAKNTEKKFGKDFQDMEKEGLPDNADYMMHEDFMDLKALQYDKIEIEKKIRILKKVLDRE